MNFNETSVYWLHLPEHSDPKHEGYIGVSKNPISRMNTHIRRAEQGRHHSIKLIETIKSLGSKIIEKDILLSGEEIFCYEMEQLLRPVKNIGWNVSEGGKMGSGPRTGFKKNPTLLEAQKRKKEKEQQERDKRIANGTPTESDLLLLQQIKEKEIYNRKRLLNMSPEEELSDFSLTLRPICNSCNKNFCAINYKRKKTTHYRRICDECGRKKKKKKAVQPSWVKAGYKKKTVCDSCGFKSLYPTQMTVFYIDGDLTNVSFNNLRTICLNCVEVVKRNKITWRRGDLQVDY